MKQVQKVVVQPTVTSELNFPTQLTNSVLNEESLGLLSSCLLLLEAKDRQTTIMDDLLMSESCIQEDE